MADVDKTQDEEEIVTEDQHDIDSEEEEGKDWKAEALKHRAIADRLKKKLSNPPINSQAKKEPINDELVNDVKVLKEEREKRQFGFEHNLSPEETDYAFKFSGGKPSKEILENEFFKGGIESLRSKKRLEANTPGSSSSSSVFQDKPFSELKEDERKNAFESRVKSLKK